MPSKTPNSAGMSIGAVSKSTGIPTATLRTWERRYGFPDPCRNESGHRVYDPSVVARLKLVDRAIEAGHRASQVVDRPTDQLRELVGETSEAAEASENETETETETETKARGGDANHSPGGRGSTPLASTRPTATHGSSDPWLDEWMGAVDRLDGETLNRNFRGAWNRMGALDFLENRATPFLCAIGEAWRDGELGVVHEHYASQCFRDFLSGEWRQLNDRSGGPKAICATLPGEDHVLGLHMAAVVLAMAEWQVVFLGPRTPMADIVHATRLESAAAVFLSISPAFDPEEGEDSVTALRRIIDPELQLVTGGGGAPRDLEGVLSFNSFEAFYNWANDHREKLAATG